MELLSKIPNTVYTQILLLKSTYKDTPYKHTILKKTTL